MHLSKLISVAAFAIPSVYSKCIDNNRSCYWTGTAPFCDAATLHVGNVQNGDELIATSAYTSDDQLYYDKKISHDCYVEYGSGCFSGHKNLWCSKKDGTKTLGESRSPYRYTYTTNDDGSYKIVITPEVDGHHACTYDNIKVDAKKLQDEIDKAAGRCS